ncbi:MAG TPA: hypothetical protein VJ909_06255 [Prolixibacteraceae bacterium]|nr:hypothetical protein [Prolixibacteraceae bacterium]
MKRLYILILVFGIVGISSAQKPFKKYPFKSGIIEYKMEGNAKGTQVLYWDEYGYREVSIEKSEAKIFGQTIVTNKTTLTLGSKLYEWSEGDTVIYESSNPIAETWEDGNYDEDDVEEFSLQTIESLGYEKTGSGMVVGKKCDIYDGLGKIWVWKGLSLRTEVKMLGVKTIIAAESIKTNTHVPGSVFKIPSGMRASKNVVEDNMQEEYEEEINPGEIKESFKSLFSN